MALPEDKFLIVNGSPANFRQPMKSSGYGPADLTSRATIGWADYNHGGGTQSLTASVWATLLNDGAGSFTQTGFAPSGTTLWNTSTNRLSFTGLSVGDMVDLRTDFTLTIASAQTDARLRLVFGVGSASEFTVEVWGRYFKSTGTYNVTNFTGFYIGSLDILNNPCRIDVLTDANSTIQVNGWYIKAIQRAKA